MAASKKPSEDVLQESNTEKTGNRYSSAVTKRVILVIIGVYSAYHHPIVESLRKKVSPLGYGVLCVSGREIVSDSPCNEIPCIYRIASRLEVAGTIIMAGSLGHDLEQNQVLRFVDSFKQHNMVATDISGENCSSVAYDNEDAMRTLVEHVLDQVPGNNIAFLSGFTSSRNSIEREKAFRDVMTEQGRQIDESLMLSGKFTAPYSVLVVDKLLSSGRCPDAIVAANDAMASGAIDALEHHGKNVPDDVVVSGFDNDEYARSAAVPLSTIAACPKHQMQVAADELLRLIEEGGAAKLKDIRIPGRLVLRNSSLAGERAGELAQKVDSDSFSEQAHDAENPDEKIRLLGNKNYADTLANHEIRERFHVRLARCADRNSVYGIFSEAMQALSIRRAYLVDFQPTPDGAVKTASLLHAWPERKISDIDKNYPAEQLLPAGINREISEGILVMCGVEIDGRSVGALLFDPRGPERASMDGLAQTTFGALRHFDQCDDLEQQADELACVNDELVRLANLDPLTGLANRSRLLAELYCSVNNGGEGIAIVFFDLDGFKPVNDTLGHAAGDRVLKEMGGRLSRCLRESDVVARFGGDEFVVLLRDIHSKDDVEDVTQQLLSEISRPMSLSRNRPISLTASVGIACFSSLKGDSSDVLLQHADTAMYRAKHMGGNRIVWFSDELAQEVSDQLLLEQSIHEGLRKGQFRLAFQPRVELATGRIASVEALLRWRRADGTDVSPGRFIETAEQSGLVVQLDTFALQTACMIAAKWYQRGIKCCMSVNMSVAKLQQPGLAAEIKSILAKHDLPPELIELEVTETAAMTDIDANINTLKTLRDMGLQLSIDDFGAAYSSLSYLRHLPVNCVKIDRMFLTDIDCDNAEYNADARIMKAMIALGSGLGLRVVAEGVENETQLNFLNSVGCNEAQGFFFSGPLEQEAIEALLIESFSDSVGASVMRRVSKKANEHDHAGVTV